LRSAAAGPSPLCYFPRLLGSCRPLPTLSPGKAVAVYFEAAANRPFTFLGALGLARPSANFPLPEACDEPEPPMGSANLGVTVEDVAALPLQLDEWHAERVTLRVGENLFYDAN
jgi:protein Hikeshi